MDLSSSTTNLGSILGRPSLRHTLGLTTASGFTPVWDKLVAVCIITIIIDSIIDKLSKQFNSGVLVAPLGVLVLDVEVVGRPQPQTLEDLDVLILVA